MPPCYHEFLAVQKGHGLPGIISGDKAQNVITDYHFCGVRNVLHLYPLAFNVEIIYKNNKVITESEFLFLFQVIDIGLVKTVTTKVMHFDKFINGPMELPIAGGTSAVVIFHILVNKLKEIIFKIAPGNKKYFIYSGPIVDEQLRLKTTRGSVKIPWFQSTIVVHTKSRFLGHGMKFDIVRSNLPIFSVKLEKDKDTVVSLPNEKCTYGHSIYCGIMVS